MGLSIEQAKAHLQRCGYSCAEVEAWFKRWTSSPDVWREFETLALRLASEGKKAGAVDILARVRWERQVEQRLEFKVNNNDAPYYARIFALKHPQHKGFFEFRKVGGDV